MPQAEPKKGDSGGGGDWSWTHRMKNILSRRRKCILFWLLYFVVVFCLCVNLSSLIGALFLLIQAINKHSLWHATYITDILAFDLLFIIRTRKRKVENPREISLWVRTMFASHRISNSDRIGTDRIDRGLPVKLVSIFNILYLFLSLFFIRSSCTLLLLFLVFLPAVFNDEIYILSLIYQSEWRAIATISAQSRMLICEADFCFIFRWFFRNFDLFDFGIKKRLSNEANCRSSTNECHLHFTLVAWSAPISGSSPWILSD